MDTNGFVRSADALQGLRHAIESLRAQVIVGTPGKEPADLEGLDTALSLLERHEEALHWKERQLEEAIQQVHVQRLRYRELFEFAPDAYLVTDPRGIILEVNHAAAELFRTRKEFLFEKPLAFFVDAGERRQFYHRLHRLTQQPAVAKDWDIRLRRAKAQPRDVLLAVAPVFNDDGMASGFRWLLRDITVKKQAEQALRAERDFVARVVTTAPVIILLLDDADRIVRANPYLSEVSGYHQDELQGQMWYSLLIAGPEQAAAREMVQEAMITGVKEGGLHTLVTRDGRRRTIAWSNQVLPHPTEGAAIVLCGQDVTELQDAQRQALQAERLAAIGQMVAGLAHESRNALQRSQSCLSLLGLRLSGQEECLDLLQRLQKAQDDLQRIFESVRSYAAPIRLQLGDCDLAAVWREAWEDLKSARPGRDAVLCEETGSVSLHGLADPFRLKLLFRNLLENSLAAAADPVRIGIRCCVAKSEGEEVLQIIVRDNGPGFSPEQRQKLFEPFHTTKVAGTGLGLAICKRIVEAHGGRIDAADSTTPGAEVRITMPWRKP